MAAGAAVFVKRESYGHWFVQIIGRLAPAADERRASAVLDARLRQIVDRKEPGLTRMVRPGINLVSGRSGPAMYKGYFLRPLAILRVIAGVMLLIACVNLASLLLARGAARRHEMAIRTAIGAGRFRLVRQMLAESLLLSFMGGAAGLALARWASGPLTLLIWPTRDTPRFDLGVDTRVVLFTLAVSLATACLRLIPAIRASRADPVHGLRDLRRMRTSIALAKPWSPAGGSFRSIVAGRACSSARWSTCMASSPASMPAGCLSQY